MICILNHEQVKQWEETGNRPSCKFHHHTTYKKAILLVEQDGAFPIAGERAIVAFSSLVYMWQGRRSAGFSTLQLCPISGRKSPLPLCSEARRG